jgi:hypothetical protein
LNLNLSLVSLHDSVGDSKPESNATRLCGKERVKEFFDIFLRNPGAIILKINLNGTVGKMRPNI